MNLTKNKKGIEMALSEIIGWILVIILLIFVIFWFSGLGNKTTMLIKSLF